MRPLPPRTPSAGRATSPARPKRPNKPLSSAAPPSFTLALPAFRITSGKRKKSGGPKERRERRESMEAAARASVSGRVEPEGLADGQSGRLRSTLLPDRPGLTPLPIPFPSLQDPRRPARARPTRSNRPRRAGRRSSRARPSRPARGLKPAAGRSILSGPAGRSARRRPRLRPPSLTVRRSATTRRRSRRGRLRRSTGSQRATQSAASGSADRRRQIHRPTRRLFGGQRHSSGRSSSSTSFRHLPTSSRRQRPLRLSTSPPQAAQLRRLRASR